jgi:hypothetical protein
VGIVASVEQLLGDILDELKKLVAAVEALVAGGGGGNAPAPGPTPTPVPVPLPPTVIEVAWVDQSQGDLKPGEAAAIVEALNAQVVDLDAAWPHISTDNVKHVLVADANSIPAGAWPMYWLPNSDVAGALGFHDTAPDGSPYGRVFTRYNGVVWPGLRSGADGVTISNISSHEATEIAIDPGCQATATNPANGDVWALEDADPVEVSSYDTTNTDGTMVSLSDFVTAAFFGMGTGPVDHTGNSAGAFTISSGGYAIVNNQQRFADKPSLRYLSQQGSPVGRTYRRLHGASD